MLDEPTTGLHADDVQKLLKVLQRLLERGDSVVCIEHHLDVVAASDHVIEMGPEAGADGGRVVVTGTPEEVSKVKVSHTGRFLAQHFRERRAAAKRGERPVAARRAKRPERQEERA